MHKNFLANLATGLLTHSVDVSCISCWRENEVVLNASFPTQDMKRARRMFKQIDCDNLPQTTKRMVAEAFASPKAMYLGHHGGGGEDPNSREDNASIDYGYRVTMVV